MHMLNPWPLYNQLNDWTVDADGIDENRENNCGPESVAMCLKYLTGVELPADFIKDVVRGDGYKGYTFMTDLSGFLQRRCEVRCAVHTGDATTKLEATVKAALDQSYPIIVLFFWKLEQPESGHFAPVIGYDETGCTRANPWGGVLEKMTWAEFEQWQKMGACIVLERTRAHGLGAERGLEADPLLLGVEQMLTEAEPYIQRLRGQRSLPG